MNKKIKQKKKELSMYFRYQNSEKLEVEINDITKSLMDSQMGSNK